MNWEKWVLLGVLTFSTGMAILSIGRPRTPTTPGQALAILLVNVGLMTLVVLA